MSHQLYPTRHCGEVTDCGEASLTTYPTPRGGVGTARRRHICQHQGGEGLGWTAWLTQVNSHLNVVKSERPKMLSGRSQQATQRVRGLSDPPPWVRKCTLHAVGGKREPKPILSMVWNVVSPYASQTGQPSVSRAYGRAGMGWGESERLAVMAGIGVATLHHAKAGRLPRGVSSQESLTKL